MKKLLVLLGVALVCLTGCSKETKAQTNMVVVGGDEDYIGYVRDEHIEALDTYISEYYGFDDYTIEVDDYYSDVLVVYIYDGSDEPEIGCMIDKHYSIACVEDPY